MRAAALNSIYQNFIVLKEFWDQAGDFNVDSECHARIIRVQAQITQFSFLFKLVVAERILQHTDNLRKTLQNPNLTAAEGEKIVFLTWSTLLRMCSDDNFDLFWERVLKLKEEFGKRERLQLGLKMALQNLNIILLPKAITDKSTMKP